MLAFLFSQSPPTWRCYVIHGFVALFSFPVLEVHSKPRQNQRFQIVSYTCERKKKDKNPVKRYKGISPRTTFKSIVISLILQAYPALKSHPCFVRLKEIPGPNGCQNPDQSIRLRLVLPWTKQVYSSCQKRKSGINAFNFLLTFFKLHAKWIIKCILRAYPFAF